MTIQVQDTRDRLRWRLKVDQITRVILSAEFDYAEIKDEAANTPLPELMNELKSLAKKIEGVR
tara:strand:- start:108 stop:296 length:189 start_codon:yes stop_codon:yes gene_type:complete